jgi:hypothetical protein
MISVTAGLVPAAHQRRGRKVGAMAANAATHSPPALMGRRDKPGGDGEIYKTLKSK